VSPAPDSSYAEAACRVLALHPADEEGRMLSAPALKAAGKVYAFAVADEAAMVKLPAPRVAELIRAGQGDPCSPRPGRPMREWVRVPATDVETCLAYLLEARSFVSGGTV